MTCPLDHFPRHRARMVLADMNRHHSQLQTALGWSAFSIGTLPDPGFCDRLMNCCRCSAFLDSLGFPFRCFLALIPLH